MSRISVLACVLASLVAALSMPTVCWAGEADADPVRAAQIQEEAREALEADRYADAVRLAGRAVDMDPSLSTWLARQVRIEALEALGRYEEALTHVEEYLDLDGLFAEHRAWGKEARERLRDAISASRTAVAAKGRRG